MKKRLAMVLAGCMMVAAMTGCGSSSTTSSSGTTSSDTAATEAESESGGVLRVGMECAYAPFNWTQDTDTTPDGSTAVPIYDSNYYAYGYDVAVAQMLADEMGMELEVHKVEWSSIGISMDSGDYDCIIAGMGKTAEREMERLRRESGIKIQGGGPQNKFNLLLLPWSLMIQAFFLFNVYWLRRLLRRDILRCPLLTLSYLGSHSKSKISNYFSHTQKKHVLTRVMIFLARRIFSLGGMGGRIHSVIQ